MRRKICVLAFVAAVFVFLSCDALFFRAEIEDAEFSGDFRTICVHYDKVPSDASVSVTVYGKSGRRDGSFCVVDFSYNAFRNARESIVVLNKEVPEKGSVVITAADGNSELFGKTVLYRK